MAGNNTGPLYIGKNDEISTFARNLDHQTGGEIINKVEAAEIKTALNNKDFREKFLSFAQDYAAEIIRINGMEEAIRNLLSTLITNQDLTNSKESLSQDKEALVLLFESLYGGQRIVSSSNTTGESTSESVDQDAEMTTAPETTEVTAIPELTDELWAKFTLKQSIKSVSGIPANYASNLNDIELSENNTIATIKFSMVAGGQFKDLRVKDNNNKNDNQTIVKFVRNSKNIWELSTDQEDTDLVMTNDTQAPNQIMRFPTGDNKANDKYLTFTNGTLALQDYLVPTNVYNTIKDKGFGHGITLGSLEKYTGSDTIDSENQKPYYIASIINNKKTETQQVMFDQNGEVIEGQNYTITASGIDYYYTSTQNSSSAYMKKPTNLTDNSKTSYTTNESYNSEVQDENITQVELLPPGLKEKGYFIDYVPGESYHIMQHPEGVARAYSVLSIPESEIQKLQDGDSLPIYLSDQGLDNHYYELKVNIKSGSTQDTAAQKISLTQVDYDASKLLTQYIDMLGTKDKPGFLFFTRPKKGRHGGAQYGLRFDTPQVVHPTEDSYYPENIDKTNPYKLMFKVKMHADDLPRGVTIKDAEILLQGKLVYGMPDDYDTSSKDFVATNNPAQKIVAETPYGLKSYKIGMRKDKLYLDEEENDDNIKNFLKDYTIDSGEKVFANSEVITLKDKKQETIGYALDATISGGKSGYMIFDMHGNIVDKNAPAPDKEKEPEFYTIRKKQQAIFTDTVASQSVKDNNETNTSETITDTIWKNVLSNLNSTYIVNDKNNALLGLSSEGKKEEETRQAVKNLDDTVQEYITEGGYTLISSIDAWDNRGEIMGYEFTVQDANHNSYLLYFPVAGGGGFSTHGEVKIDTDNPIKTIDASTLEAEIIGNEKLVIGTNSEIKTEKEIWALHLKNKEKIAHLPDDKGNAGILVGEGLSEKAMYVPAHAAIEHMYTLMQNDDQVNVIVHDDTDNNYQELAQKLIQYRKDLSQIITNYNILGSFDNQGHFTFKAGQDWKATMDIIKKDEGEKYPALYATLNKNNGNWSRRKEKHIKDNIQYYRDQDIKNHRIENWEKSGLQKNEAALRGAAITYMKDKTQDKFKNYTGETTEIKDEEKKKDEIKTNQGEKPKNNQVEILIDQSNENKFNNKADLTKTETSDNTKIETSVNNQNKQDTYQQQHTELNNLEKAYASASTTAEQQALLTKILTLTKEGQHGVNPQFFKNKYDEYEQLSKQLASQEQYPRIEALSLPQFTWSGYKPGNTPPSMTLHFGKDYQFSIKDEKFYNNANLATNFNSLINLISHGYNIQNAEANNIKRYNLTKAFYTALDGKSTLAEQISAIQQFTAQQGGISNKMGDYKLNDGKIGINTYAALVITLYKNGFGDDPTVQSYWNALKVKVIDTNTNGTVAANIIDRLRNAA